MGAFASAFSEYSVIAAILAEVELSFTDTINIYSANINRADIVH